MMTALVLVALSQAADAPVVSECDKPGVPADIAGTSYCLRSTGEPAPIPGRLLSFDENERRGKKMADLETELAKAKADYVLMPRPVVAVLIALTAAAVATAVGVTVAAAEHKL